MTGHLAPCIAQFSVAVADDSLWKPLNYQILLKTRDSSPKVRCSGAACSPCGLGNWVAVMGIGPWEASGVVLVPVSQDWRPGCGQWGFEPKTFSVFTDGLFVNDGHPPPTPVRPLT